MAFKRKNYKKKSRKGLNNNNRWKTLKSKDENIMCDKNFYENSNKLSGYKDDPWEEFIVKSECLDENIPPILNESQIEIGKLKEENKDLFCDSKTIKCENDNNVKLRRSQRIVLRNEYLKRCAQESIILKTARKSVCSQYIVEEKDIPPECVKQFLLDRRIKINKDELLNKNSDHISLHLKDTLYEDNQKRFFFW